MLRIKRTVLCLMLVFVSWSACAQAEDLHAIVTLAGGSVELSAIEIEGENWLFLPTGTELDHIVLKLADGSERPFPEEVSEEDGIFSTQANGEALHVMRSENIRSLFLFSDDPVNEGRAYIDGSPDHSAFTTASMALVGSDGHVDHAGDIRHLRGRGNGTWRVETKKPYQFKLEDRMDLLDTGDPNERNRTWVLLAMLTDSTYMHDRLTFDIARELGDQRASHSEYVNLYYDGEYRGLYLLCEKTEIGSGRVDELDYDKMIESWNEQSGMQDLESLPEGKTTNRFGNPFTYLENVPEIDAPGAGAFLLEMENEWMTLSDPCWFRLSDGSVMASKNPEKASQNMMRYISERMEEAWQTLQHRGVNPETGRTIADDFDVEGFARSVLLSELSGNLDSWLYSSTYFVLPAGESRFEPGPPWDYDLAYRYRPDLDVTGFRDRKGWIPSFLKCPDFLQAVKDICQNQLSFIVKEILLGEKTGQYVRSIDSYAAEINAARRMNEKIWITEGEATRFYKTSTFEIDIELLKQYLHERSEWLFETVEGWDLESPDRAELWADSPYVRLDGNVQLVPEPWCNIQVVSYAYEQITEATEENYALWKLDAVIAPLEGFSFSEPIVTVNGTAVESSPLDDGTLAFSFIFEDPSYRPADAYGEDIGLVYDYDYYVQHYPDVAKECEYDPDLVMEYFLYDGMYEGHQANEFFDPSEILFNNPKLEDSLGEDWWLYYTDYIAYGYVEWQLPATARFDLNVMPVP